MENQFEPIGHKGYITESRDQMLGKAGEQQASGKQGMRPLCHEASLEASPPCWPRLSASFSHASLLYRPGPCTGLQHSLCLLSWVLSVQIPGKDADWPGLGHGPVPVGRDQSGGEGLLRLAGPGEAGRGAGQQSTGDLRSPRAFPSPLSRQEQEQGVGAG